MKTRVTVACVIGAMVAASLFAQAPPQVPAPMAVSGRVVADDTGQPLRLALVVIHGPDTRTTRAMMSDAEGRFTFEALPQDRYRAGASKAPYVPAAQVSIDVIEAGIHGGLALTYVPPDAAPLPPNLPGRPTVAAVGDGSASIIGRVVDEVTGAGVAGVRVMPFRRQGEVVSDASGTFRFDRLGPGTYNLRVQESGYTSLKTGCRWERRNRDHPTCGREPRP